MAGGLTPIPFLEAEVSAEQSEKTPFKSRFAVDLWISPSQHLAEQMVARIATRPGPGPVARLALGLFREVGAGV